MKKNKSNNSELNQEKMIEKILRTGGFVLPTSDEEIKEFERIYGTTDVILPEELQTPNFLFDNSNKRDSSKIKKLSVTNFAMAAREGREILSDEVKKKMETDRRKSDAKRKGKNK